MLIIKIRNKRYDFSDKEKIIKLYSGKEPVKVCIAFRFLGITILGRAIDKCTLNVLFDIK
jgi:hypothetical protein